ncbi:carbon-nitrogen hydrolase family protein [Halomonas urmiana]|uniref:Carbon-nitrogen hydrolase family protein n=1 Tax=Halomonas urmiana TaxID=490901 RepID=A0A5R8MIE6_9GAMM|nr:carbon-nitrogen hydrolase family protein [Halomonas urmiana]TLF51723.1 carbon-nitrogen hydrolase family protein [Halomonas urmiana]
MATTVAVIQKPPVLLQRDETLQQMLTSIDEAVGAGATLLVFPEAYIPGYPTWIWRLAPGGDMALTSELHARLRENAVDLGGNTLEPIQEAAARHEVTLVTGLTEIDRRYSGTTLYNSVVVIGPDGRLLNRHRKLMPTNPERMVWGMGDASGLRVVETPAGRLGCLICWESYMPLARYALYAQDLDVFINPTWDSSDACLASLRHIAREGGCWVIGTATAIQGSDVPVTFPERDRLFTPEEWINVGNAVVIAPSGEVVAGPLNREKGILYAEIEVETARRARRSLDVCGHYARPDLFSLTVNRSPLPPVVFSDD